MKVAKKYANQKFGGMNTMTMTSGPKCAHRNEYEDTHWHVSGDFEITHWMPLPAPPSSNSAFMGAESVQLEAHS